MVRSSNTKTSKETKQKTAPTTKSKSTGAVTSKTSSAKKSSAETKPKKTAKTVSAVSEKQPSKARNESPQRKSTTTSSAKNKAAAPSRNKLPEPKTPELFEHSQADFDTPPVSILPALGDEPIDYNQADIEAKTPPEFREMQMTSEAGEPAPDEAEKSEKQLPAAEVTFSYLGFTDAILSAIRKQKFDKPTPVQALCLPHTLDGKDVAGFAQTGTGKTAVYLLTAAQKFLSQDDRQVKPHRPHGLVVVPTRELADQVSQDAKRLLGHLNIKTLAVFGGVDVERHISELNQPIDLVVATPGRLLDLHRSKKLELDDLQLLVIDECDRMFDMGFIDDVEYVLRHLPSERVQKLLFSATGSEKVKELAFEYLENPEYIETDPVRITPEKITQVAYAVTAEQKFMTLLGHVRANNPECAIIFTNTKVVAEWVGYKLACNGLDAEVLTGDLPQRKRMTLIKKIKEGKCNLLVATDVLSRGLHVANLSHVYNFDIPDDEESFIHRIGRTARAGATGYAITLICEDYGYNMGAVEKLLDFQIPLAPVPNAWLTAEDKSDYPFDSSGRVKVFGQKHTAQGFEGEEQGTHIPSGRPERAEPRASTSPERPQRMERPEPTLPHHRRSAGPTAAGPTAAPVSAPQAQPQPQRREEPRNGSAGPVAAAPRPTNGHAAPSRPMAAAQNQPHKHPTPGQHPRGQHAASTAATTHTPSQAGYSNGTAAPRRDEKARETIDMAIQAAKKAAARRQSTGADSATAASGKLKVGKARVTEHIDEIASAVLTGAQEKLGGAFGNIQERFVSRFEENFPRLSETLVRLGFFPKRFTDDR